MKDTMKNTAAQIAFFACAAALALAVAGCGVKKINYEKKVDNEGTTTYSYRIYQNDHWLNTKASAFKGGMDANGKFEFQGEGLQSSPSEEFNRTMQTYTTAFVQLAQIAAAAYNPSASLAAQGADPTAVAKLVEAQSAAKTAEISAKSQRETANIKAASEASIAAKQAESATASADCPNGECNYELK